MRVKHRPYAFFSYSEIVRIALRAGVSPDTVRWYIARIGSDAWLRKQTVETMAAWIMSREEVETDE